MTFPETLLPIQVDLMVAGAWQDITEDVYNRDAIRITRGRSAEGAAVNPGVCELTLNNRSGRYSPRWPMSPWYGQIGRNTPLRVSVLLATPYLFTLPGGMGHAQTAHNDAFNVSTLDVRVDLTPTSWQQAQDSSGWVLAGRYDDVPGAQSWYLVLTPDQRLQFGWVANSGLFHSLTSAAPVPFAAGHRGAIRVTLEPDRGWVTWYTAETSAGPWTQLEQQEQLATSLLGVTAPLQVGQLDGLDTVMGSAHWHSVEVRDGVDGTVVASADFSWQTPGATSFTDSVGRPWTVTGDVEITDRLVRFEGEVPAWPPLRDTSGQDRYIQIQAAGILRRLGVGQAPLQSTLRRRVGADPSLLAYWPMEDGDTATQAASALPGGRPMTVSPGGLNFAAASSLAGSSPLPTLDSNSGAKLPLLSGLVPAPPVGAGSQWKVEFVYRMDTVPTPLYTFMRVIASGTAHEWYLMMDAGGGRVHIVDADGDTIQDNSFVWGTIAPPFGDWYRMQLTAHQAGSSIAWQLLWIQVDQGSIVVTDTVPGTLGRVTSVGGPPAGYAADLDGLALGHVSVMTDTDSTSYDFADHGYNEELAAARLVRLASEEHIPFILAGDGDSPTEAMGPQLPKDALDLMQEAVDADQGILFELREAASLIARTRGSLYNQTPVSIRYEDLAPGLAPVDDDQLLANDVTVSRASGSSARVTQTDGPLSTAPPPAGVGPYPDSLTLNLGRDEQAEQLAAWLVRLGTIDEPRYPTIPVNLARVPDLIEAIAGLDTGGRFQITDLAADYPPGVIDALIEGYTETLAQFQWDWTANCVPGAPYAVAEIPTVPSITETFDSPVALLPHTDGGDAPWRRVEGIFDAWVLGSGQIDDEQTSDAIFTMPDGATSISFQYLVASEAGGTEDGETWVGDQFLVYIDGVLVLTDQGAKPVQTASFPVRSGSEVTFRYAKDDNTAEGLDAAFINDLTVALGEPEYPRADTGGSELAAVVDADGTTLSVTTTGQWPWVNSSAYPSDFPFDVQLGGEVVTATVIRAEAEDAFGRTVTSGWGTADTGQTWTTTGGSASDYSVQGV